MPVLLLLSLLLVRVMMPMLLLLGLLSLLLRSVLRLLFLLLLLLLLVRHQRRKRGSGQLGVRFRRFFGRFSGVRFALLRLRALLPILLFLVVALPLSARAEPHKLHLLEERVAIGLIAALDGMHGLVVHQPHLAVCHHQQARVVAHDHHAALELVDGLAERVDGLDISAISARSKGYKWLVGSSKSRMCGWLSEISAKVTRAFCPPERFRIAIVCAWPSRPYRPSRFRTRIDDRKRDPTVLVLHGRVERLQILHRRNVHRQLRSSLRAAPTLSTKCCEYLPIRSFWLRRTSPLSGTKSPSISFTSVDFPIPLGPTIDTRDDMWMPKSTFFSRIRSGE